MLAPHIMLAILLIACLANAIGDVFLLNGVRKTDWEPGLEALEHTPRGYIMWGAFSGLATIPAWFLIAPYLAALPGWIGVAAFISFAAYVAATFAFHMSYAFIGPSLHERPALKETYAKPLGALVGFCFLMAVVCSVVLAIAGWQGVVEMRWYHYALLPAPAVVLIQMIAGTLLAKVPFAKVVAGPIAMAAFFAAFTDMICANRAVFGL